VHVPGPGTSPSALTVDPDAPDEARTLRFGREGEIATLLEAAGFEEVVETTLHAAGQTDEALMLQARAAERFAGVGDDPMTSPEIWRLVDW